MKIRIVKYPFFRSDFVPAPSQEEKTAYIGIVLESINFLSAEDLDSSDFPAGVYMVPIHFLLEELMKLDELQKLMVLPRWLPLVDLAEEKGSFSLGIAADCCEEVRSVN